LFLRSRLFFIFPFFHFAGEEKGRGSEGEAKGKRRGTFFELFLSGLEIAKIKDGGQK
jgi:hypothetical protein